MRGALVVCGLGVVAAGKDCCWCDDDTPEAARKIVGSDSQTYSLVFSDEFNQAGRTFANGEDAKWTALDIGDTSNKGTAFYLPSQAVIQEDMGHSSLVIVTENASHTGNSPTGETGIFMPYRSAMLQSWNKFCFTGGIVEFRARQPRGGGYWPALWIFGNLGRAVYQDSNTGLWPWSYDMCDGDLKLPPTDPPQRISACMDQEEDSGLHPFQGRGATELDVLEGAVSNTGKDSYVVGSLQLSPGLPAYFRPIGFGSFPAEGGSAGSWYADLTFGPNGYVNNGWYGPPWGSDCPTGCPDALSGGFVALDNLDTEYWTYKMEWKVGPEGGLAWYYNDEFVWSMSAGSFGAYSVCAEKGGKKECKRTPPRMIPQEPMSLVMNTAIGTWNGGQTALDGKHWPAKFYIDYVRVWQAETNIGCNPPDFPTKTYISKHAKWYGEPAKPSGYDTCPESYPESAFKNAERIKARGAAMRASIKAATKASPISEIASSHFTTFAAETASSFSAPSSVSSTPMLLVGGVGAALLLAAAGFKLRSNAAPYTPAIGLESLADNHFAGHYELAK